MNAGQAEPEPESGEATEVPPVDEDLVADAFRWIADATLLVHTVEELRVVPFAPRADDMWELGKLCSERMGVYQKVNRAARSASIPIAGRERDRSRHFQMGGRAVASWVEALMVEVVVGPYFRLFFESFLRSSDQRVADLAHAAWQDSQPFIRFGQARIARAMEAGDAEAEFQAALDRWLPAALELLDEVPGDLDEAWLAAGIRDRTNDVIREDYLEEMATYVTATDLAVPAECEDQLPEPVVRWTGDELAPLGNPPTDLQTATFAYSKARSGRDTASAPLPGQDQP